MPHAGDQHLVHQAQEGNHAAFRQLVERHMKRAYDVAYNLVGNHHAAEDVAQDAFVRAYQSLRSFRGEAEFGTWLYRIVVNLALNRIHRSRRKAEQELQEIDMESPADPGHPEQQDVRMHIERALHELPTMQRAVVILRHIDGLSTRQVSTILKCSEGTVKTHLFRGLRRLRSKLSFLEGA